MGHVICGTLFCHFIYRLQQAIEEGDVQLAMQWSSQLAQRKLKLNVSVDPDQDVSDEEDIQ